MKIDKNIHFYSNTPDNTHCFQAVLKMVIKYFWPNENYSWEELEKITAKEKNLWTWPMSGLLWLSKRNVKLICIETFDYKKFIKLKGEYLIEKYGKEVGEAQIKHSNIEQEIDATKDFVRKVIIRKRTPTISDLKRFLVQDYLLICNVNSNKLNNKSGYTGHFVLLKGLDNNSFIIHNPGPPPLENQLVAPFLFEQAWAYPNDNAKNLVAVKLNRQTNSN
jgi:hypothetical protein